MKKSAKNQSFDPSIAMQAGANELYSWLKKSPDKKNEWRFKPYPLIRAAQLDDKNLFMKWANFCYLSSTSPLSKEKYGSPTSLIEELVRFNKNTIGWIMEVDSETLIRQAISDPLLSRILDWHAVIHNKNITQEDLLKISICCLDGAESISLNELLRLTNGKISIANNNDYWYGNDSRHTGKDIYYYDRINNISCGLLTDPDIKSFLEHGLFFSSGALIEQALMNQPELDNLLNPQKFKPHRWTSLATAINNQSYKNNFVSKNIYHYWKLLINNSIDLKHIDYHGKSAFDFALSLKKVPDDIIIKMCKDIWDIKPALVNKKDRSGKTIFDKNYNENILEAIKSWNKDLMLKKVFKHQVNKTTKIKVKSTNPDLTMTKKRKM